MIARVQDTVGHALFFDIHVVSIKVDEDIIRANPSTISTACQPVLIRWDSYQLTGSDLQHRKGFR